MKNFIEFLAQKDPTLLQEYIELNHELLENKYAKYLAALAGLTMGATGTTHAHTPTPKQIDTAAEDKYKDPRDSETENQLYKRLAFGGHTLDSLDASNKTRYQREKDMFNKVDKAKLPTTFRPGVAVDHIEDNYLPKEILFRKIVNPYEIIKSNIPDPEKFQKDYDNLKSNPNDIGFSMDKYSLMNNRVLLIIVTDQAMKRVRPNADGYAANLPTLENPDASINTIVLPKRAVKEIKDGKITLTPEGEQTLRHEGRHTGQEGEPGERAQGTMSPFQKGYFKHYMNDPREIGVRLGELKNHLSAKTLLQLTNDNPTHNNNIKQLLNNPQVNEKELLKLIMKPPKGQYQNTLEYVREKLGNANSDMGSLFKHYDELSDVEKRILMQELLDNYDNVVKKTPTKQNYNL